MSQFENQRSFSQDTFGMPQDHPTPLSNTYTFNPAHHHPPPSPLLLSPFTPRPRPSRWDDDIKLFDPHSLSPLQENLQIELQMMQKEEQVARESMKELPFIIEEVPKRRSARIKKAKITHKKKEKKGKKEIQTKILSFIKRNNRLQ